MSGQLHTHRPLYSWEKSPRYPLKMRMGESQSPSGHSRTNLPQKEPCLHEYPVRSLVTIRTELHGSQRTESWGHIDHGLLLFGSKPCKLTEQRLFEQDCESTHRTSSKHVQRKVVRIPAPTAAPLFHFRVGTNPFP